MPTWLLVLLLVILVFGLTPAVIITLAWNLPHLTARELPADQQVDIKEELDTCIVLTAQAQAELALVGSFLWSPQLVRACRATYRMKKALIAFERRLAK